MGRKLAVVRAKFRPQRSEHHCEYTKIRPTQQWRLPAGLLLTQISVNSYLKGEPLLGNESRNFVKYLLL